METELKNEKSTDQGLLAISPAFNIMSINQKACRLLHRMPNPGEKFPPETLFDQSSLKTALTLLNSVFETGLPTEPFHAWLIQKNADRFFCTISILPMVDSSHKGVGALLCFKPLCRKPLSCSEPSLKLLPRLNYQGLLDGLPKGVITIDSSWRISSFNRTAEQLTGFTKAAVIGRHCWDVFQSDNCRGNCPLADVMTKGGSAIDQEVTIVNPDGIKKQFVVNAGPLKTDDGRIVGGIHSFHATHQRCSLTNPWEPASFEGMIGKSSAMREIYSILGDVANSRASVLITGESGTGKELIARAIHNLSPNAKNSFTAVNCSALAESLLESELFGYEKGAFTGAEKTKPGRFEQVGDGTLFLDEIGELKPYLQVKLLRVLEEKEFERVGGSKVIPMKARIISATNQPLKTLMKDGIFREDLYYRLRTVPIQIPPLRKRIEDIPLLVDHFVKKFNLRYSKFVRLVDPKVIDSFMAYHWPGNVRELERAMEHAFVFVKGPIIFSRYLPDFQASERREERPDRCRPKTETQKNKLLWALEQSSGNRAQAAELLGISRTSIWRRMKASGLLDPSP